MSASAFRRSVLYLSSLLGGRLEDAGGGRLGRVDDLIVRLGAARYPPITGLRARIARRELFVPVGLIERLEPGHVRLSAPRLDLRRFERRPDEVLLRKDVLDRQLINLDGARLVRANDIALARAEGAWRVVGVDTGPRGVLRRLLPRALALRLAPGPFLDWASVEPFLGHVPSVRVRVLHPRLARLHPAQIADLVEAASHQEGEEIIDAVGRDEELEADVFEELDPRHQREFLAERSDDEVAALLERMAVDDVADLLADLDDERREPLLAALPAAQRRKVRTVLGYDPATAGGLMSPDFVCLYDTATVAEALARVRASSCAPEALSAIFAMDTRRRLTGAILLPELLREDAGRRLGELAVAPPPRLRADSEFEEVARTMADFNLVVAPVVDDEERQVGVVTVDDVLEILLPSGWRRRFGLLGGA